MTADPIEARKHLADALAILYAAQVGADDLKDELKRPGILITAAEEELTLIRTYSLDETILEAGAALQRAFDALGGTRDELGEAQLAYLRRIAKEGEERLGEIEVEEMRRRGDPFS